MDSRFIFPAHRPNRRALIFLALLLGALWPAAPARAQESVMDTVHNLSRSGPGALKSTTETDACGFCHVPHAAEPRIPLWGHALSNASYKVYTSPTLDAAVPQPNGASKLCLGCHDGTIALGDLNHARVDLGRLPAASRSNLGTDLSGSHPVSLEVGQVMVERNNAAASTLADLQLMLTDPDGVRLDAEDRLQCTSCHDAHSDANYKASGIHFWRKPTFSEVCLVCHLP